MVPSCLIMKPPYAESTAPFFSNASDLRFSLPSDFPGAVMRSSLMGKTLLCALVSTCALKINFPLLFWLNYLKCYKGFFGRFVSRVLRVFHSVNLKGPYSQNFTFVIVAPVLNCVDTSFKDWPYSLVKLFPFARMADRLPVISFTTFST